MSDAIESSPDLQRRYIDVKAKLLDSVAASQVAFADIGLTNSDYTAQPALGAWDRLSRARKI